MAEPRALRAAARARLTERADEGATVEELQRDIAEQAKNDGILSAEDYEELRFYAWALVERAQGGLVSEKRRQE